MDDSYTLVSREELERLRQENIFLKKELQKKKGNNSVSSSVSSSEKNLFKEQRDINNKIISHITNISEDLNALKEREVSDKSMSSLNLVLKEMVSTLKRLIEEVSHQKTHSREEILVKLGNRNSKALDTLLIEIEELKAKSDNFSEMLNSSMESPYYEVNFKEIKVFMKKLEFLLSQVRTIQ